MFPRSLGVNLPHGSHDDTLSVLISPVRISFILQNLISFTFAMLLFFRHSPGSSTLPALRYYFFPAISLNVVYEQVLSTLGITQDDLFALETV